MAIIYTYISSAECKRLSTRDNSYTYRTAMHSR